MPITLPTPSSPPTRSTILLLWGGENFLRSYILFICLLHNPTLLQFHFGFFLDLFMYITVFNWPQSLILTTTWKFAICIFLTFFSLLK